jgi:hypothetical protein
MLRASLRNRVLLGLLIAAVAQSARTHVPEEILERPLPLRDGIGKAHEDVTTIYKDAQAYYGQGLAYLHSYVWIEAARSFHAFRSEFRRIDPASARVVLVGAGSRVLGTGGRYRRRGPSRPDRGQASPQLRSARGSASIGPRRDPRSVSAAQDVPVHMVSMRHF